MEKKERLSLATIEKKIFFIRSGKVMLGFLLASNCDVSTKRLNEQVRSNIRRFPSDFMFELTSEEYLDMKSHFVSSIVSKGGSRYILFAFTEQGVTMLLSGLNSEWRL